ncbi:MAG: T9SS type A sorting domain-containing protein, partial [Flavobacteriales bacterium]|nr:T9SS type A sorting domain-containing protein [Flavobacteriales bacterium]
GHVTTGDPSNPTITSSAEEIILVTSGLYNNPSNGTVYRFGSSFVGVEDEPQAELGWSAFPNPTDGLLTLYTGNPEAVQFDVYDLAGRIVNSGTIFNTEVLDIQAFESGIYLVRMTQGNEVRTVQIVKQ